ncbi:CAP domain-containing protein [Streptomyces sp. WAC06614]|uniref:CAP domain-containing protein n=1 Tax=Streptomyces sp. WAC06614 TaxID=2487416 RepID=UPI000F7AB548|nr:CAP domain-containing protein [Streptomyces sp. WAC06614]RSS81234.1 CAP domain-containing protein [Streptomyces sp. WAC06614]
MGRHGAPRAAHGRGRLARPTALGIAALAVAGGIAAVAVGPPGAGHAPGGTSMRPAAGEVRPTAPATSPPPARNPAPEPSKQKQEKQEHKQQVSPVRAGAATAAAHRDQALPNAGAAATEATELVNVARAEAGCEPLSVSPALTALAVGHSKDMALDGYFGHGGPDGSTLWQRAARSGTRNVSAENIARGPADPQALLNAWMARPGSRANILNCGFRTMGTGAYFNGTGFWWTEDFAA